ERRRLKHRLADERRHTDRSRQYVPDDRIALALEVVRPLVIPPQTQLECGPGIQVPAILGVAGVPLVAVVAARPAAVQIAVLADVVELDFVRLAAQIQVMNRSGEAVDRVFTYYVLVLD